MRQQQRVNPNLTLAPVALALAIALPFALTRCDNKDEFTQLTEAIKQIVPPPLSHGHAEDAAPRKKSNLFSRKSSSANGQRKSVAS